MIAGTEPGPLQLLRLRHLDQQRRPGRVQGRARRGARLRRGPVLRSGQRGGHPLPRVDLPLRGHRHPAVDQRPRRHRLRRVTPRDSGRLRHAPERFRTVSPDPTTRTSPARRCSTTPASPLPVTSFIDPERGVRDRDRRRARGPLTTEVATRGPSRRPRLPAAGPQRRRRRRLPGHPRRLHQRASSPARGPPRRGAPHRRHPRRRHRDQRRVLRGRSQRLATSSPWS